jgi:mRNA-degrading endonuclease toxin of MazEF toxin-antitoxin module
VVVIHAPLVEARIRRPALIRSDDTYRPQLTVSVPFTPAASCPGTEQ